LDIEKLSLAEVSRLVLDTGEAAINEIAVAPFLRYAWVADSSSSGRYRNYASKYRVLDDFWKERREHSPLVLQDKSWVTRGRSKSINGEVWTLNVPAKWFDSNEQTIVTRLALHATGVYFV